MKLAPEQIEYVSNYIQSFDIKFYELQVELTDHFVLIMEEIWSEDPELTFHQVKYRAEQRFGRGYFKEIEVKRAKVLRKEYKRIQLKMVAEYLKFPKIIMSILLVIVVYRISFYFENLQKYVAVLFGFLFVFSLPMLYLWVKYRIIDGKRFLAIDYSSAYLGLMIFPQLGINLSNLFKDEIQQNHLLAFPFIFLWTLGVLFCITGLHLYRKNVNNVKKQYQLT